jgi:hypothetical protein
MKIELEHWTYRQLSGHSKVCELCVTFRVEKNVSGFDVAMDFLA